MILNIINNGFNDIKKNNNINIILIDKENDINIDCTNKPPLFWDTLLTIWSVLIATRCYIKNNNIVVSYKLEILRNEIFPNIIKLIFY